MKHKHKPRRVTLTRRQRSVTRQIQGINAGYRIGMANRQRHLGTAPIKAKHTGASKR